MSTDKWILSKISMRVFLVDISQNVHIIREERKFTRFVDVSGKESEADCQRDGEPEECRFEQEVVVTTPYCGDEPSRRNSVVDSLYVQ